MPFNFGGQTYISPTVVSSVNDTALVSQATPGGSSLLLIGQCSDGQPNTVLTFYSPTALQAALGSGDLVDAGIRAFNPSPDVPAPASVSVIRVNPAVQATRVFNNAGATQIGTFTSKSYGARSNLTAVGIAAGTTQGYALTAVFNGKTQCQDNVYQGALSIVSSGTTPTVTINGTLVDNPCPSLNCAQS